VSVEAAAGPGKGLGFGVAGRAKITLAVTGLLLAARLLVVALFSVVAAPLVVSSPARLVICCAHNGKANRAFIASAAHQLRISILLSIAH